MRMCARLQLQTAVVALPHTFPEPPLWLPPAPPSSPAGRSQDPHSKTRKSGKLRSFREEIPPQQMLSWAGVLLDANFSNGGRVLAAMKACLDNAESCGQEKKPKTKSENLATHNFNILVDNMP